MRRRAAGGPLLLLLVAIASALAMAGSDWLPLMTQPQARAESDFQLHWAAGQALARGLDPWDPATVNAIGAPTGRAFTPFCAANPLVLRLFSLADPVDWRAADARWLAVNHALLALAVLLLALALRRAGAGAAAALALALGLVALNDGTWMGQQYNQLNAVTLLLVVAALLAGQAGRPVPEGVLLALAAAAKTSPALLVVLAALAGRRVTALAAFATAVGLLAVSLLWSGLDVHLDYLSVLGRELGYVAALGPGEFNNSLHDWNLAPNGVLSRAAEAAGWPRGAALAAVWAVSALVLALAARWALRRRRAGEARAAAVAAQAAAFREGGAVRGGGPGGQAAALGLLQLYGVGVAAGFLVSSVTWPTHLSLAALPAAAIVLTAWHGRAGRGLVLAGALACAVLFLPLGSFEAADPHQRLDVLLKMEACAVLFAVLQRV